MEKKNTLIDKLDTINEQLDLTHYWITFLKYKKLLFLIPLAFGLLGYLVSLNIKPIFKSTATLVIESEIKKIVDIDEVYGGESASSFGSYNYINNSLS